MKTERESKPTLIGRRPCGCVVAFDMDVSTAHRIEMIRNGYTVEVHELAKAREIFATAKANCGHGGIQEQLASKLSQAEDICGQYRELKNDLEMAFRKVGIDPNTLDSYPQGIFQLAAQSEITHLTDLNRELVEALEAIISDAEDNGLSVNYARAILAKAKGTEK